MSKLTSQHFAFSFTAVLLCLNVAKNISRWHQKPAQVSVETKPTKSNFCCAITPLTWVSVQRQDSLLSFDDVCLQHKPDTR